MIDQNSVKMYFFVSEDESLDTKDSKIGVHVKS